MSKKNQRPVIKQQTTSSISKIPGLGHHTFTSSQAEWYGCMMKSDSRIKNKFEATKYTLKKARNPLTLSDIEDTEFLVEVPESVKDNFYSDVETLTTQTIADGKNASTELLYIGALEEKRKALKAQLRTVELQMSTNRILRETALMKVPDCPVPLETKFRLTKVDYSKPIKTRK